MNGHAAGPPSGKPLPPVTLPIPTDAPYNVSALLGGSLRVLWLQRTALLRAMALPLAAILLMSLTQPGAPLEGEAASAPAEAGWMLPLLGLLIDVCAIALFIVGWYRFLLGYGTPRLWPGLDAAQLRFFALMLLIYFLPLLPLVLVGKTVLPAPLLALVSLGLIYVALRWSLVLPAAAVGVALPLRRSWQATAGNAAPLFFAPLFGSIVVGAVVAVPILLLTGFFVDSGRQPTGSVAALILWCGTAFVTLVTLAQAAAVLAIAVVRLVPDPQSS